ncbi:MAG TPA: OsmC family protein [Fodinibius sp.]|nr:OsmC family protein [Fodinibius sp.]
MSSTTAVNPNTKIKEAISKTITGIENNPNAAEATFKVSSKLERSFQAEIEAREFHFVSDEPEELGGSNKGPNPVEYVLGALAACQEIAVKAHASQLGIELESVQVEAEGDIDLHGFLDLSDERPGFKEISYRTTIKSKERDDAKLQKLKALSENSCPVLDIIQNATPVNGNVRFVN